MIANFKDCSIKIRKTTILSSVNFTLRKQQCIYLKGENGSGKTVFIEALLGFHKKITGQYTTNINNVCYIPDISFFTDEEAIKDVIKTYKVFYNQTNDSILESLSMFSLKLDLNMKVSTLSLGTKKKLELLPLFFGRYPIYILDEIFQGLDSTSIVTVINQLQNHFNQGSAILYTEHNQSIVSMIQDSIKSMEVYLCENQSLRKVQ